MAPATGVVPGPFNVTVVPLMVAEFMGSLKRAVTTALGHAPWEPLRGTTERRVGGVVPLVFGVQHPTTRIATSMTRNALV
jgi:hypothetical protein